MVSFAQIFDANLLELTELTLEDTSFENELARQYAHALYKYLKGQINNLEEFRDKTCEFPEKDFVLPLIALRNQIRQRQVQTLLVNQLLEKAPSAGIWSGEIYFVVGLALWHLQDNQNAMDVFSMACAELKDIGAERKSLKALCNKVTILEKVNPEQKFDAEHRYILKKSKELGDTIQSALSHLNLSRQYHQQRGYQSALKNVNLAIDLLDNDIGTIHYYLARVHKAFLLYALGDLNGAEEWRQEVLICNFPAILSAAETLAYLLENRVPPSLYRENINAIPNWDKPVRVEDVKSRVLIKENLSKMEQDLFSLISVKPIHKYDLIEKLYGAKVEIETSENRFKNLLNRFRKKHPEMIVCNKGVYSLQRGSDPSL